MFNTYQVQKSIHLLVEHTVFLERILKVTYHKLNITLNKLNAYTHPTDIMDILVEVTSELPTPSRLWFGPKLVIVVGKAEDMKIVLNSPNCLEKAYVYQFFLKNVGLFSAPGLVLR